MDVARTKAGKWIVIEVGDGGVTGLPDRVDRVAFLRALRERWPVGR